VFRLAIDDPTIRWHKIYRWILANNGEFTLYLQMPLKAASSASELYVAYLKTLGFFM
jgi:hypothetical protein